MVYKPTPKTGGGAHPDSKLLVSQGLAAPPDRTESSCCLRCAVSPRPSMRARSSLQISCGRRPTTTMDQQWINNGSTMDQQWIHGINVFINMLMRSDVVIPWYRILHFFWVVTCCNHQEWDRMVQKQQKNGMASCVIPKLNGHLCMERSSN